MTTLLTDEAARRHVLTDLDATLLVEAGAGVGKTSLMAARVTMLLANGTWPEKIAAITFTELAASELATRVRRFVDALVRRQPPEDLALALEKDLTSAQYVALEHARENLNRLTCTTIHGFCQALIRPYPLEAALDPGARVMDEVETTMLFDRVFDAWLMRRLGTGAREDDPIAALARREPRQVVAVVRELARKRRQYRTALPSAPDPTLRPDRTFIESVRRFRTWYDQAPQGPATGSALEQLETLARGYEGALDGQPTFDRLWSAAHPEPIPLMLRRNDRQTYVLRQRPFSVSDWSGVDTDQDQALCATAFELYDDARRNYSALLGQISRLIVDAFSQELDEFVDAFDAAKRNAALLDFDDLLLITRKLLQQHEPVRQSLMTRFSRILVDEYQDTDAVQSEILFLLTADGDRSLHWSQRTLLPARLFAVGDPKQAIYRFRGADIQCYQQARAAFERCFPGSVIQVTHNFRAHDTILGHINRCFAPVLTGERQAAFADLRSSITAIPRHTYSVARVDVPLEEGARTDEIREAEATAIATFCARLVGRIEIRAGRDKIRPLTLGDIALLTPVTTKLWIYERAFERAGLPLASHAGRNFFLRQETQDLLALTRALSDPRDTAAFGAFMRGPLVGLTDDELLDITQALSADGGTDELRAFTIRTDASLVPHPLARRVLSALQALLLRRNSTTPSLLLSEAAESLRIRPLLAARYGTRAAQALSNLDVFITRARAYDVRGLRRFARAMTMEWNEETRAGEARVDPLVDAVQLLTMHGAKGLEWPVVIPINSASGFQGGDSVVYRRSDNTLHWRVGDVAAPDLAAALDEEREEQTAENQRLWYVACTRAMDLLLLPHLSIRPDPCWARLVDLQTAALPVLEIGDQAAEPGIAGDGATNNQTMEMFEEERARISKRTSRLVWVRPSAHDDDKSDSNPTVATEGDFGGEPEPRMHGSALRGSVLHKLMEEILTGELAEELAAIEARSIELLAEHDASAEQRGHPPMPSELAETVNRTLRLPDIVAVRDRLIAEVSVYGPAPDQHEDAWVAGRADAVALTEGKPEIVFDWKSDVAPTPELRKHYAGQLQIYMRTMAARRGGIVYMSHGEIDWVSGSGAPVP